jgi:hypothetical protein
VRVEVTAVDDCNAEDASGRFRFEAAIRLRIQLPVESKFRCRLFERAAELAYDQGLSPVSDDGQTFLELELGPTMVAGPRRRRPYAAVEQPDAADEAGASD